MKKLFRIFLFLVLIVSLNASYTNIDQNEPGIRQLLGTWKITNFTIDPIYSGYSGQVTFYRDEMIIDSGRFAAAGLVHNSEDTYCYKYLSPISHKYIGDAHFYIWWNAQSAEGDIYQMDAMLRILRRNGKQLTVIGQGGCGRFGAEKISYLEKIY